MVKTDAEVRSIHIGFDRVFKGYSEAQMNTRETITRIKLGTGDYRWIKNIKAENKPSKRVTTIFIEVNYPKFFNPKTIKLLRSEAERKKINVAIRKLLENICRGDHIYWEDARYQRVDVAEQFKDVFENYFNVCDFLYRVLQASLGQGNHESKKFLQVIPGDGFGDLSTGFRYKKGDAGMTAYNKTLQNDHKNYIPFMESEIRWELILTPKVLGIKEMFLTEFGMGRLRKEYNSFLQEALLKKMNDILASQAENIIEKLEEVFSMGGSPQLRDHIKDMSQFILDEEQVVKAIHHLDLKVSDRQKRNYKNWVKESLAKSSADGQFARTFHRNFNRLIKVLYKLTNTKLELTWDKNVPILRLA